MFCLFPSIFHSLFLRESGPLKFSYESGGALYKQAESGTELVYFSSIVAEMLFYLKHNLKTEAMCLFGFSVIIF